MSYSLQFDQAGRLQLLLQRTRAELLKLRGDHGHWEGELSSSALSTATATIAIHGYIGLMAKNGSTRYSIDQLHSFIDAGIEWLVRNQNEDGGWGDTDRSKSNISTTCLVWAALAIRRNDRTRVSEERCEKWICHYVGSIEPNAIARSVTARYGRDKTFSVPILTALALMGRLGSDQDAWKLIPHLPFELAACPHQWFALLKLPVVSYALPALIAMGQVHHERRPTWNPIFKAIRNRVRTRTDRVLESIQPTSGGFLEATPLTSFVVMSLIGAGGTPKSVIDNGIDFLVRSIRSDGSWPIDTNLATWTTTLAINAIRIDQGDNGSSLDTETIHQWIKDQQYRVEHPYTHAKPGGWAWTDLTGGVPDADDTSGAILAIRKLGGLNNLEAAQAGITWLLDLQNRDGGVPTFCRGWGTLPFDRSSTDITAHAIRAWLAWYEEVSIHDQRRIQKGIHKGVNFLKRQQRNDGTWAPLWFGNQFANPEENLIYGTTRVLLACTCLHANREFRKCLVGESQRAIQWILEVQNNDGGWGSERNTPSSIEETSLTMEALSHWVQVHSRIDKEAMKIDRRGKDILSAIDRAIEYIDQSTNKGTQFVPSPIGFYFAKLWYYEKMYPIVYTLAALEQTAALAYITNRI